MNPRISNLLRGGGSGGDVLPPAGRTMLANRTSSLILDEGTGGPTWSRATKAWGFNELGYLTEIASGCAFFGGARLVRNLCTGNSDNFSGATLGRCSIVSAAVANHRGTNTAVKYLLDNIAGAHYARISSSTYAGMRIRVSVVVKRDEYQYISVRSGQDTTPEAFNLTTNTWINGAQAETVARSFKVIDATWIRLTVASTVSTGTKSFGVGCSSSLGSDSWTPAGTENFTIADVSICDVTGYDASYVPEYVSVGVEAAPYFGAGIDGAQYFETDWQGAPIAAANLLGFRREAAATNNLLHSRDLSNSVWAKPSDVSALELVVNGGFADSSSWDNRSTGTGSLTISGGAATVVGTDSNNRGWVTQTKSTTVGKVYRVSCDYTAVSGTTFLVFGSATGTGVLTMSTTGAKFIDVVASSTTMYIGAQTGGSGGNGVLDNISLKETAIQTTAITGLDGIANTATTLTATAANAIILQPITLASAARCASAYVKRRTGTGTISFTQDGGSTWTDITSQINSSTWSRVPITATLANPSVGFKISTSGDAIDVDCVQNEAGAVATSPIVTTTAAVTRNADSLTYQTASNWSDTAGTAYIEAQPLSWVAGGAIGSATNGLLLSAANSGATASDGTNTANGPAGAPSGREKLALRWGAGAMTVASGGVVGTPGTYDGGMGLASVGIAVNSSTYCGRVAIYDYAMTDAELQAITA